MTSTRKSPGRIFINYRRDDVGGVAGRLADSLDRYFGRGRVFRDVDHIQAGSNFEQVLHETTRGADAMIVLIGPRWVSAADAQGRPRLNNPEDWVAREIATALERGISVYPLLVESAVMPRPEELPEPLRPLVRYNAMSISDQRWQADVTRLARVVAMDVPGSAAERTLVAVQWVVSIALFLAIAGTAVTVAWNLLHGAQPLPLALSGVSFVTIVASAVVLLYFARLMDADARRYVYGAVVMGLLGALAFWLVFGTMGVNDPKVPIVMFGGSTVIGTAMLVLMNLSRFKPR